MTAGYYRFPTIHQDTIVFVSEDDLWSVPTGGGVARRLTSNVGEVTYPMLSPDGTMLAFVGREEGGPEIYVMPASGGSERRLTYLNSNCRVVGWTPDGASVIFTSSYGQVLSEMALFAVRADCTNGTVEPLPYGPARSIAYGPNGQVVIGRNTGDPARWKRYRGGTAGHLWIDRNGNGQFERFLPNLQGNIASPMWLELANGSRIFFVSDHEGIGNLYSCRPDGEDIRRHTDHEDYYVRNPSSDGKQIVYHVGADLMVFRPEDESEQRVEIAYHSPRIQRNRRFVDAGRYQDGVSLHPTGKAIAMTTRGKAFGFYNHEGAVLQYGKRDGVRYRLPEWLKDGRRIVLVSDEPGEEVLEIYDTQPNKPVVRLDGLDLGRVVSLKASPVEDKVALTNHRHELIIVDLSTRTMTLVDRSAFRTIGGFDWSPDGRWLAYSFGATSRTSEIRLYRLAQPAKDENADGKKEDAPVEAAIFTVTRPVLHDVSPAFDPDGKYLYFLSYREFNPVYDALHFDLGFPWGMRPYLVTLQADLPNPFVPQPELDDSDEDEEDDEEKGDEDEDGDAEDEGEGEEGEGDEDGEEYEDEVGEDEEWDEDEVDEGDVGDEGASEDVWLRRRDLLLARKGKLSADGNEPGREKAKGDSKQDKGPESTQDNDQQKKGEKKKGPKPIQIDLDGIERRVLAFPVPDARYGQIAGIPNKALFTVFPIHGQLDGGSGDDPDESTAGCLRSYDFKEYKADTLADNVSSFALSANRKKLVYVSGNQLRVINAGEKPPSGGGNSRKTGWINLHRVKVSVDPQSEWEQMFREAWRLQRDHFWSEDMAQVDWQEVYRRYFQLIPRVSTRSEFSDLMWEMQGELGTSHAYEFGGDYRPRPHYGQGFLGATWHWDAEAKGYRIDEIVLGDPWDLKTNSPLAAPGVDVQPGDLLLAINGQPLDENTSPAQLLVNQAGNEVLLTLAPRPDKASGSTSGSENGSADANGKGSAVKNGKKSDSSASSRKPFYPNNELRTVIVRAIHSEAPARYRRWVEGNRSRVHEATGGRVGYVHVPDMGAHGYAEFHRGFLAEVDREALIVDVRYNAGGHVSQLILEKLARRRIGYDISRWGGLEPYPLDSVAGPLVALTNEHAGSDGDIFCHSFKLMKLGPLIGKRTWGGVVGISPRHALVDGTVTTQPEYSFWFEDVGWNVENYGTDPDIEVDVTPQDYVSGKDTQLERAIAEALRLLENTLIRKPELDKRPSRALPKLPPRVTPSVPEE